MTLMKRTISGLLPSSRYVVRVRALSPLGVPSDWAEAAVVRSETDDTVPNPPTNLVADFSRPDLFVNWSPPTTNVNSTPLTDLNNYHVKLISAEFVDEFDVYAPFFTYSLAQNRGKSIPPSHTFDIEVTAVDKYGQESVPATLDGVMHPLLSQPLAPKLTESINAITVTFRPESADIGRIVRYEVEHSADDVTWEYLGFSTGTTFSHSVDPATTHYYRYWAEDFFERDSPVSPSNSEVTSQFPTGSDGLAPTDSPTPTATGGPGFIFARWDPIANDDLVRYEVHLGTTSAFVPSSATKVTEGVITSAFIRKLPDGNTIPFGVDYYIKLVPYDDDGTAPPSGPSAAAQNLLITSTLIGDDQISTPHLAANSISAGDGIIASLDADKITTGTMSANRIGAGTISASISISGPSITGGTIEGATFRTAGSGARVELTQSLKDRIRFFNASGTHIASMGVHSDFYNNNLSIASSTSPIYFSDLNGNTNVTIVAGAAWVNSATVSGPLTFNTSTGEIKSGNFTRISFPTGGVDISGNFTVNGSSLSTHTHSGTVLTSSNYTSYAATSGHGAHSSVVTVGGAALGRSRGGSTVSVGSNTTGNSWIAFPTTHIYMEYGSGSNATCHGAAWLTDSSRGVKKDIEVVESNLSSLVKTVKPVKFRYKSDNSSERQRWGFIAEDLPEELLIHHIDYQDRERTSINSLELLAVSWKVQQELMDRIEKLEEIIQSLQKK